MHTIKTVPISSLLVNHGNPRFEPVTSQREAIDLMLKEKGTEIKKLAQDIVNHGMNPSKNLLVVKSANNKFLTLEGNRRVVAVMLLNSPSKTNNQELHKFFQNLYDKNYDKIPNEISCVVCETRDEARHWIMLEHTGKNHGVGIEQWTSEQKDRFLNKSSKPVLVFDFAINNDIDRKNVESTNLKRLLSTLYVRDAIGISFSQGKLNLIKPESTVKENIRKVFTEISREDFTVGNIYTKDDREQWIDNVIGTPGGFQKTGGTTNKTSVKGGTTLPRSTVRKTLIPKNCQLTIFTPKINDIFLELRDNLNLGGSKPVPNAVGVMFRVFLEISLEEYWQKRIGGNPDQRMTMSTKISSVAEHMINNDIATKKQMLGIRQTSASQTTDILHIQRLHEYVHNSTIQPDPTSLKVKWNNVQEFFELLWADLSKETG